MKRKKSPTWIDVKKTINSLEKQQLIELIGDLYHLSTNNKDFFHTRFSLGEDPLESYKRIIQKALNPYLEDNEILDIGSAEEAINRYSKAVDDVRGQAELMLYFVECGNKFTLSYGCPDEDLYDSLLLMYEKAIEIILKLTVNEQQQFKERLYKILESVSGIGWGYHDGLSGLYYKTFHPKDIKRTRRSSRPAKPESLGVCRKADKIR